MRTERVLLVDRHVVRLRVMARNRRRVEQVAGMAVPERETEHRLARGPHDTFEPEQAAPR